MAFCCLEVAFATPCHPMATGLYVGHLNREEMCKTRLIYDYMHRNRSNVRNNNEQQAVYILPILFCVTVA